LAADCAWLAGEILPELGVANGTLAELCRRCRSTEQLMKHLPIVFDTAKAILQWDPKSADPVTIPTVPLAPRIKASQDVRVLVGLDNGAWSWTGWQKFDFDASPQGGHLGNVYNFQYWQYLDAIYYYLHRLAAVPPVMWIDA